VVESDAPMHLNLVSDLVSFYAPTAYRAIVMFPLSWFVEI